MVDIFTYRCELKQHWWMFLYTDEIEDVTICRYSCTQMRAKIPLVDFVSRRDEKYYWWIFSSREYSRCATGRDFFNHEMEQEISLPNIFHPMTRA